MNATSVSPLHVYSSARYSSAFARRTALIGALLVIVAVVYAGAILVGPRTPLLMLPLVLVAGVGAVLVRSSLGVYLLFATALVVEQFRITGIDVFTALTQFYGNLSGYTELPLRLSPADLLVLLALASWLLRRVVRANEPMRAGPFGWGVLAYISAFALGIVIGAARGGSWDWVIALAELRGPLYLALLYFLSANLLRSRAEMRAILWLLVVLIAFKSAQALWNFSQMYMGPVWLDEITSHEEVLFYSAFTVLALGAFLLRWRARLQTVLLALLPLVIAAQFVAQRRVGFIALATGLVLLVLLLMAERPRAAVTFLGVAMVIFIPYAVIAWNDMGLLGQPVRALRSIVSPELASERDRGSNLWREIENGNIRFTIEQLPLTGVGLGQEYFFQREPPPLAVRSTRTGLLTGFTYWRFMTHNAVYWVWLKAGVLAFLALWFFIAQVVIQGARLFRRLEDPELKLLALLPTIMIAMQIVFSSVDLGLTYSRPMIVLGVLLGLAAPLSESLATRGPGTAQRG